jgi:mono/diheme cytochrome c family protein
MKITVMFLFATALQAQSPNAETGKKLYETMACYECHGWVGQGGLAGARLAQTKLNLEGFRSIIRNPPPSNMPPYRAAVLSDREVADIFAYIQTFPTPQPAEKIPLLRN